MSAEHGSAPRLGGEGREEKQLADNTVDSAANVSVIQPIKPEMDLASWASLGANVKASRDRRAKKSWLRKSGCSR